MSEPSTTSTVILLEPQHHQLSIPHTSLSTGGDDSTSAIVANREYRKGNWTLHETLVLITAKKLDDERRYKSVAAGENRATCKTAELRWKWVENYCWKNDCLRSQNQCNDKWDNLLRDYKKVRDYETRTDDKDRLSYWKMEKHKRKERNLPSNLLFEVYEALQDVVNHKNPQKTSIAAAPSGTQFPIPPSPPPPVALLPTPPLPLPPPPPFSPPLAPISEEMSEDSSDTEESEIPKTDTKRRKMQNLGSSIIHSASVLARTLLACEEKREKRHREVLAMEERNLQIEEARAEINRQGIACLINAVNNLSGAIHATISERNDRR